MSPNYEIVAEESTNERLVIRDLGPWDEHETVTNGAETVVRELVAQKLLLRDRRLFYYDSVGVLDELVVTKGKFAGFRPGPWLANHILDVRNGK